MKISIMINYYNRQAILERCLWSIFHMTNQIDDFEIIVVDDKSPEGGEAAPVVDKFKDKLPIRLFYRREKNGKNPGMPMNIAAKMSTGDVLITHDPDFFHMTSIVNQMAGLFWQGESRFVVAACYSLSKQNQELIEKVDFSNPKDLVQLRDRINKKPVGIRVEGDDAWNCHSVHRPYALGSVKGILREDFMRLGGLDEDFYQYFGFEDTDFLRRAHVSGIPITQHDEMLVYHQWHYWPHDTEEVVNRQTGYVYNREIYDRKVREESIIANPGREWGVLE